MKPLGPHRQIYMTPAASNQTEPNQTKPDQIRLQKLMLPRDMPCYSGNHLPIRPNNCGYHTWTSVPVSATRLELRPSKTKRAIFWQPATNSNKSNVQADNILQSRNWRKNEIKLLTNKSHQNFYFSQLAETVEDGPATSSQVQKIQSPILLKLVCQETI